MKTDYEQVKEFHETFGHPSPKTPEIPDMKTMILRMSLMLEEMEEVLDAMMAHNKFKVVELLKNNLFIARNMLDFLPQEAFEGLNVEHIAKELSDLIVVTQGTGVALGIDMDKAFEEVAKSNMSKLGQDGKPVYREDGKVIKGPNYQTPDMSVIWSREEETL